MKNFNLKARLATMNFLEFGVWGAYLISMGMFLGSNGLGEYVFWFYTVQGFVSIFMRPPSSASWPTAGSPHSSH